MWANSFSFFDGVDVPSAGVADDDDKSERFVDIFVLPESFSEINNNNDNNELPFLIEDQFDFEDAGEPRNIVQLNKECYCIECILKFLCLADNPARFVDLYKNIQIFSYIANNSANVTLALWR